MDAAFLDLSVPAGDAAGPKPAAAEPAMIDRYKSPDPGNAFNPGIGRTTKCAHWMPRGPAAGKPELRCEG